MQRCNICSTISPETSARPAAALKSHSRNDSVLVPLALPGPSLKEAAARFGAASVDGVLLFGHRLRSQQHSVESVVASHHENHALAVERVRSCIQKRFAPIGVCRAA